MNLGQKVTSFSLNRYKTVTAIILALTTVILLAAAVPSLQQIDALPAPVKNFSAKFSFLSPITVDTDPENMLSHDEPVRLFHDSMKQRMDLYDMIVLGVVNEEHPAGVFNPQTLAKVYELTQFAKTLQYDENKKLITQPVSQPSSTPDEPTGIPGLDLPESDEPAGIPGLDIPEETPTVSKAQETLTTPKLRGVIPADVIAPSTVDSIEPRNGMLVFSWLMPTPPETQLEADQILQNAQRIPMLNGTMVSDDGKALAIYLPITEKKLSHTIYRALQSKIDELPAGPEQFHITGLPVAEDTFGVEMFIQMAISAPAAMILIFILMLLFFRKFIIVVSPMIVAMIAVIITMGSLIIAGFPIHIMSSMIPIFIMPIAVLDSIHIISEFFEKYQQTRDRAKTMTAVMDELFAPMLYTSLTSSAGFASLGLTPIPPVQVFGIFVAVGIMSAWLLTIIFIPAFVMFIPPSWLENFGAKSASPENTGPDNSLITKLLQLFSRTTYRFSKPILALTLVVALIAAYGISLININDNPVKWFVKSHPIRVADRVLNEHFAGTYMAYLSLQAADPDAGEIFKRPDVLKWQADFQTALAQSPVVGKSSSLADIVKTVHRDLLAENIDDPNIESYYRLPDSPEAVAECLIQYESSHRPQDLTHFVTVSGQDAYQTASLWLQLTSGDNQDMESVVQTAQQFLDKNPPPVAINANWFGLTYINVIWQDKMVSGMLEAFVGSFLVVFLLMAILFRSALWGLLSMIPLTITIAAIYGVVGLVGKDYDMPVAVLSSLTLGLAVDFAIHFLARAREMYKEHGSWQATSPYVFGEPARAITRNIIVIAAGFTPLLFAPLLPYRTVGILLATILLVSGLATLLILPAIMKTFERVLFKPLTSTMPPACNCGLCITSSVALVVLLAMNFYASFAFTTATWLSIVAVVILAFICGLLSRRAKCKTISENQ